MPRKPDAGRAVLNESAKAALERMLTELKSQEVFIRISPSSLVSWIVSRYVDLSFEKDKEAIIKHHFNSKEYLRQMITKIDSEKDIVRALESVLDRVKPEQIRSGFKRKKDKGKDILSVVKLETETT